MADRVDKWFGDLRKLGGDQTEAVRREAQNELARLKLQKPEGLKTYEKEQRTQAARTARLRALRLAKEAEERALALKKVVGGKKRGGGEAAT